MQIASEASEKCLVVGIFRNFQSALLEIPPPPPKLAMSCVYGV